MTQSMEQLRITNQALRATVALAATAWYPGISYGYVVHFSGTLTARGRAIKAADLDGVHGYVLAALEALDVVASNLGTGVVVDFLFAEDEGLSSPRELRNFIFGIHADTDTSEISRGMQRLTEDFEVAVEFANQAAGQILRCRTEWDAAEVALVEVAERLAHREAGLHLMSRQSASLKEASDIDA